MNLLEVSGLSRLFGGLPAVNNCTLSVEKGERTGLIGPNGAGKSTLIDVVSGFRKPTAGRVRFDGNDITAWAPHRVAGLGLVRTFQLARVWGRLTVIENMLVAASNPNRERLASTFFSWPRLKKLEADDRKRAREILAEFDLLRHKDTLAEQLSGGQKRLLEFARIVMARPRMVLLDEPSASLSPAMSERIGEAIKQLSGAGITVVLVEHDLPLVEALCDRIIVMASGEVIAVGSMHELRLNAEVVDAYLGTSTQEPEQTRMAR